jgi:diguanylate cyclase (GGDEF)-like protein
MDELNQKKQLSVIYSIFLGYSIYTVFLLFSYFLELLTISNLELGALLTFIWTGNLSLYFFVKFEINKKLKEPYMFIPLIVWSIVCVLIPTYYMTEILRSVSIMNYFLIMVFGVFKLNLKQFISVNIFSITLLGFIIIMVIKKEYISTNPYNEILIWGMFSVTSLSFAFVCNSVSELRTKLKLKQKELMDAFSDIQKISVTDELTNIYNRRYAINFMANKKIRADKGLEKFIVCMIDIDHFKKINDTYGHDVGDIVLKSFAREVNHLIRNDDCFARFGGEEFLLILSHIDLKIAKEVVYRIMNKIQSINIADYPELKITVSVGIVEYQKEMLIEDLLKESDKLLYKAKENGRNQFKC